MNLSITVLEVPVLIVVGIGLSLNTENLFLSDVQTSISMTESITEVFFQLAGTQRLDILQNMKNQDWKMSGLAKKLDSTLPHIHRDFNRLVETNLIEKKSDGDYRLTSFGKILCDVVPLIEFMSKNQKYFDDHEFEKLPKKFIDRLSSLSKSSLIHGYVKVSEKWKEIYENADDFICNILVEVSYNDDIMNTISKKINSGVKIRSIFSPNSIMGKERKESLKKYNIQQFVKDEKILRKTSKSIHMVVVLNEKEAGISFLSKSGFIDLGSMFYSNESQFYEWCKDYFEYVWQNSNSFQENNVRS